MIPTLAAIGVSILSRLAERAFTALAEGNAGGSAPVARGNNSFGAMLERSYAPQWTRVHAGGANTSPPESLTPTFAGGSARDAASGLLTAQLAGQRVTIPRADLLAVPRKPVNRRVVEDLIGRKIAANGSVFELRGSTSPMLPYRLPTAAASVQIEVRDLQGRLARTVQLGPQPGGLHRILFDGRGLSSGAYVYRVIATDVSGAPIARVGTASGRVSGVRVAEGQAFLAVGGSLVPHMSVFEVGSDRQSAT